MTLVGTTLTGVFGVVVWVGGLIGFINSGSVVSCAAGSVFGVLLLASAYMIRNTHTVTKGYLLSLGTTLFFS